MFRAVITVIFECWKIDPKATFLLIVTGTL